MYFLRPDRILCSFLIDPSKQPYIVDAAELSAEVAKDSEIRLSFGIQAVSKSRWTPLLQQGSKVSAQATDEDFWSDDETANDIKCTDQRSSITLTGLFGNDSKSLFSNVMHKMSTKSMSNVLSQAAEFPTMLSLTTTSNSSSAPMTVSHAGKCESSLEMNEMIFGQEKKLKERLTSNRQQQQKNTLYAPTGNNGMIAAAALSDSPERTWRNPLVVQEHAEIGGKTGDLPMEEHEI